MQVSQEVKDELVWYIQEQIEAQFRDYVDSHVKQQIDQLIEVYRLKIPKKKVKKVKPSVPNPDSAKWW